MERVANIRRTVTVLALRNTVAEHDDFLRFGTHVLHKAPDVRLDHTLEVGNDLGATFLQTNGGTKLGVLAIDGGHSDSE